MSDLQQTDSSNYLPDRNDTSNYLPIIVTDPDLDKIEVIDSDVTIPQITRTRSARRIQGLIFYS